MATASATHGGGDGQALELAGVALADHLGDHGGVGGEGGIVDLLQLAAQAALGLGIGVLRLEMVVAAAETGGHGRGHDGLPWAPPCRRI
jgi:hypothetical protein